MPYIILLIYLVLSLAFQLFVGNFPVNFFAFPLNLIIALIWYGLMLNLYVRKRKSLFVRFMLSSGATFWAVFLFIDACVVVGLTGERSLVTSWPFLSVLLFLQTVLFFVVLRGWREQKASGARNGKIRWRFILNHAGLMLALGSGFWGSPDSETIRIRAYENQPVREGLSLEYGPAGLGCEIVLNDFVLETYENGVPSLYQADLTVDSEDVTLRVNKPYSLSIGKSLYLVGYDTKAGDDSTYCILQIVNEPWRYGAVAGIIMMLLGAFLLFVQGPDRFRKMNND